MDRHKNRLHLVETKKRLTLDEKPQPVSGRQFPALLAVGLVVALLWIVGAVLDKLP